MYNRSGPGGSGVPGGTPLFGIYGYVPLEQGMVFKVLRVYNFTTERLQNRVSALTGSLLKSVKTCDERPTFVIPTFFSLNIYFHDFSVKN